MRGRPVLHRAQSIARAPQGHHPLTHPTPAGITAEEMRTDFDAIEDDAEVMLIPKASNTHHRSMVKAIYSGGTFYCDGSTTEEGPHHYTGDTAPYKAGRAGATSPHTTI